MLEFKRVLDSHAIILVMLWHKYTYPTLYSCILPIDPSSSQAVDGIGLVYVARIESVDIFLSDGILYGYTLFCRLFVPLSISKQPRPQMLFPCSFQYILDADSLDENVVLPFNLPWKCIKLEA